MYGTFEITIDAPLATNLTDLCQGAARLIYNGMAVRGYEPSSYVQISNLNPYQNITSPTVPGYGIVTFIIQMTWDQSLSNTQIELLVADCLTQQLYVLENHPSNVYVTLQYWVSPIATLPQVTPPGNAEVFDIRVTPTPATALPPMGYQHIMM